MTQCRQALEIPHSNSERPRRSQSFACHEVQQIANELFSAETMAVILPIAVCWLLQSRRLTRKVVLT